MFRLLDHLRRALTLSSRPEDAQSPACFEASAEAIASLMMQTQVAELTQSDRRSRLAQESKK